MIALLAAAALSAPTGPEATAIIASMIAVNAAPAQRTERWTYHVGAHAIPVDVAVRDADFRVSLKLGGLPYASGRFQQTHWRTNGNGVAHGTQGDQQGDAADHVPDAPFAIDPADCSLVGKSDAGRSDTVVDAEPYDVPHRFTVDALTHRISRETFTEGRFTVTYVFDRDADGSLRGWTVNDGNRDHAIAVTLDERHAQPVAEDAIQEVFRPRTFTGPQTHHMRALPAQFVRDRIMLPVEVAGHPATFMIDTGNEQMTYDIDAARAAGLAPELEHATASSLRVGDETLANAALYTANFKFGGMTGSLGYDWFFGHVVHINYVHRVLEVGDDEAAAEVFADPKTVVVPIDTDQSMLLVPVTVDGVVSQTFAIDTGSARLMIFGPFLAAHPEISKRWSPTDFASGVAETRVRYDEGDVDVAARSIHRLRFGPIQFTDATAGVEEPNSPAKFAFDGMIGTEILRHYDLWFDYDHRRLGLRPA